MTKPFGIVAIGRDEGERLKRCINSLPHDVRTIYVDSGSSDGSQQIALDSGAELVELNLTNPFTAARARNAGFRRLLELEPDIKFVQFIDGDCELARSWPDTATSFLRANPDVAAVFGRRRELHPDRSIYNQLCDWEWDGAPGECLYCGGDVMIRASVLKLVNGYRDKLIAGEEPELCVRLRAQGWKIFRLNDEMTLHDAAMTRFYQWWKRTIRSGYAFAEGAYIHGSPPERHWVWETRRAWIWGLILPVCCVLTTVFCFPWGAVAFLVYPAQTMRQMLVISGSMRQRGAKAFFQQIGRFAELLGQLQFWRDTLTGNRSPLIEYK